MRSVALREAMAGLPEHGDSRVRYGDAWRRASEGSEGEPAAAVAKEAVDGEGREQDDDGKGVGRRHQAMQWKASAVSRLVPAAPRCQWKVLAPETPPPPPSPLPYPAAAAAHSYAIPLTGKRGLEEEDKGKRGHEEEEEERGAAGGHGGAPGGTVVVSPSSSPLCSVGHRALARRLRPPPLGSASRRALARCLRRPPLSPARCYPLLLHCGKREEKKEESRATPLLSSASLPPPPLPPRRRRSPEIFSRHTPCPHRSPPHLSTDLREKSERERERRQGEKGKEGGADCTP
uniref:Uncharacterized protein n=1 Tax=Oryza rufipogon TaxID=4529 RepID=A0A0E0PMQ5_ORYRU